MLGLIFGRNCGLGCAELKLGRLRLFAGPRLGVSDFLATGPLGDGMASDRGLGAIDGGWLRLTIGADLGSRAGVALVDAAGVGTPAGTAVSIRAILGRGPTLCDVATGAAASGSEISVIVSSVSGTSFAWPMN